MSSSPVLTVSRGFEPLSGGFLEWQRLSAPPPTWYQPAEQPQYEAPPGYPEARRFTERSAAAHPLPPEMIAEMCARLPRRSSAMRQRLLATHVDGSLAHGSQPLRRHSSIAPPSPAPLQQPQISQKTPGSSWWRRARRRWVSRISMRHAASAH